MKHLLITLSLLCINTLLGQELIGKDWKIDNFLALHPEVTDTYILTDSEMKRYRVGRDSIPLNLEAWASVLRTNSEQKTPKP